MLIEDKINIMLIWFKRDSSYWNMVVIESLPIKSVSDFGIKIDDLGIQIDEKKIFLGVDGAEAMTIYKWDATKKLFTCEAP